MLVNRPVLAGALITGGAIKPGDAGMKDADQGEADCGASSDSEEGAAHRRKQRQCTAEKGHKKSPHRPGR